MKIRIGWLWALWWVVPVAMAQGQAQEQTQAQRAAPPRADIAPNALRDAALTVAQAVDAGQAAQLWQSSSPAIRDSMPQQQFIASLTRVRQPFGRPEQRQWTSVAVRDVAQQGSMKAGRYGSVDFSSTFTGNRRAHELVSFRLDEDGQWRFVGYVIESSR